MANHVAPEAAVAPLGPTPARQAVWLVGLLIVTFSAAALGSVLTGTALNDWYPTLHKPAWNPPNWVFGPVWTTLYLLMSIAAWLVYRRGGWRPAAAALSLYAVQLALNVAWSALFFGLRAPGLALIEIVVLWLAIAATISAFWNHSRLAALLLAPYLAWTSFAALLNLVLWRLNS